MNTQEIQNLSDQAKLLLEQLQSGDEKAAVKTMDTINQIREKTLYEEIGKLTRSLHDAIVNFHLDTSSLGGHTSTEDPADVSAMEDAKDRLSYVINLTENAANRTMDMVEETIPISEELFKTSANLREDWGRLLKRELSVEEFRKLYRDMDEFLAISGEKSGEIGRNLSNILMAQDYQDLTGQVIKKVITLVNDVEGKLVELVTMASRVEDITGIEHSADNATKGRKTSPAEAEGPLMRAEKRTDVVNSQDDVDDLLSSLGF